MRWLIFALGVALALGGAASIASGVPYIRMESGWTEVIAGTTALSAGIMTVALGAILSALRRLEPRFAESKASATPAMSEFATAEPMPAVATDLLGDGSDVAGHEPDAPVPSLGEPDITPIPASRPPAERMWYRPSVGLPGDERAEPSVPVEPSRTTDRSSGVGPVARRDRDARRASLTRGDAADRVPSLIPSPRPPVAPEVNAGPVSTILEVPTVVGRYESGGASYVLFSDGTIEVETEIGTHRFASMEELKTYIDQQQTSGIG